MNSEYESEEVSLEAYGKLKIAAHELVDETYTKSLSPLDWENYAREFAERFEELDEAMTNGGQMPHVWVVGLTSADST